MTSRVWSKLRWPPAGLGLGTPLNLALASAPERTRFARWWWLYVAAGIGAAAAIVVLDQVLFAGISAQSIRRLGAVPPLTRLGIILFSAFDEEIEYRLVVSTLVAWIAAWPLARLGPRGKATAIWIGIVAAAVYFGFAHVGNLPNAPHPYLRAIVLNGVTGILLGWLYWYRGLEAAILAHLAADAAIYFGVASFL